MNANLLNRSKFAVAIRETERRNNIPEGKLYDVLNFDDDVIEGNGRNRIGVIGIAGLLPSEAQRWGVQDRTNPYEAIAGAGRMLRYMYVTFGSWPRAVQAYKKTEQKEAMFS